MAFTQCTCVDEFPTATLLALRTRLIVRLGMAAIPTGLPGMAALCNDFLIQAQELLYRRYAVFRTERWFTWTLQQGERFYDLPDNDEQTADPACTKALDPRKVTTVWLSKDDEANWRPMTCGIDPGRYGTQIEAIPDSYEIRQCIEIWPAPSDDSWRLNVKGHFGLSAFAADSDTTTIDAEAVFLLALANAKAHYGQPDAGNYLQQLNVYIADLTAGSHQGRRYFPGKREPRNAVPPRMV